MTLQICHYMYPSDDMATYVINEEHKVVIGDKIKTVSLENDMSEADKAVFAIPTVVSSLPGIEPFYTFQNIYADSKKVSGSVNLESNYTIRVHVGTQKKCGMVGKGITIEMSISNLVLRRLICITYIRCK